MEIYQITRKKMRPPQKSEKNRKTYQVSREFATLSSIKVQNGKSSLKTITYSCFVSKECVLIDQLVEKQFRRDNLNELTNYIALVNVENCDDNLRKLLDEILSDEEYNWGRIIIYFAFIRKLLEEKQDEGELTQLFIDEIIKCSARTLNGKIDNWIGVDGWTDFKNKFQNFENLLFYFVSNTFITLSVISVLVLLEKIFH